MTGIATPVLIAPRDFSRPKAAFAIREGKARAKPSLLQEAHKLVSGLADLD